MKASEMRDMTLDELRSQIKEAQERLMNLRMSVAVGRLDNPSSIRHLKRDIARLKTVLREHELNIRKLREAAVSPEGSSGGSSDDER